MINMKRYQQLVRLKAYACLTTNNTYAFATHRETDKMGCGSSMREGVQHRTMNGRYYLERETHTALNRRTRLIESQTRFQ